MALSTVTVTGGAGGWSNPDGTIPAGVVQFQPVQSVTGGGYVLAAEPVTAPLIAGNISKQLVSNAQVPSLQYIVTENIVGAANPAPYVITPTGTTLDLTTAPRGILGMTTPLYVLASTVGQANGIATLDGAAKIPIAQLTTGTTPGTLAAGDDTRLNGNLKTASNLGDIANPTTARANLGAPAPDVQFFTANGTWTKPVGAKTVSVTLLAGGGGGGSGRRGAAATVRCGGGGGGGAAITQRQFDAGDLTATVTILVGVGGAGGAAVTANDTSGNPGVGGGSTTFGQPSYVMAFPGTNGSGGTAANGNSGFGGSGIAPGGNGGAASATGGPGVGTNPGVGASGGGGGGGITSADVPGKGADSAYSISGSTSGGGTGGLVDSTLPTSGVATTVKGTAGGGSGGGAASITTAAQAGAAGILGAGGGGGGASLNGFASGAGGNGGPGACLVITHF